MKKWLLLLGAVLVCVMTFGRSNAGAQSGAASALDRARSLYDSASFDEALAILDRVSDVQPETDVEEVQRYRALCLLALNRTTEAQNAIEIVFSRDPMFRLSDGDAPPRMRAAFADVRRRLLPKVTEQLYASAKLSFDRKEYELAATQFNDFLTFLEDADAKELPSLKEFRTLAAGFRDLSQAAPVVATRAEPPPAADPVTPVAPPGQVQTAAALNAPAADPNAAGAPREPGVLRPPVAVKQQMPLWTGMKEFVGRTNRGLLRVIVDEHGGVEEARIVQSIHPVYDQLLLSASRTWTYEPAMLDGKPVRYVKMIEVILRPH
jgi:tetratricopeptide (TPR) repeat protein